MNKFFLLLIVFYLSIIQSYYYDYLLFVQEIAGTVCQQKDCTGQYSLNLPQTGVNMHGLWPNYNNGSYPTYCGSLSNDKYSDNKIASSVLSQLNSNWVGLYSSTNHEWEKHGSCFIEGMPSQKLTNLRKPNSIDNQMNEFFDYVMQIKSNINLESVLFSSQQNANQNGATWSYSDLQNTLSSTLGISNFNFNCDSNNNLLTINICLNGSSYQPIDCPNTQGFRYNCSQDYSINVPYFQQDY